MATSQQPPPGLEICLRPQVQLNLFALATKEHTGYHWWQVLVFHFKPKMNSLDIYKLASVQNLQQMIGDIITSTGIYHYGSEERKKKLFRMARTVNFAIHRISKNKLLKYVQPYWFAREIQRKTCQGCPQEPRLSAGVLRLVRDGCIQPWRIL